jgi:D-alanyl-D-alanine carboxypeptidase
MQFYGNFFIHGWPTYDNGKEVPIGYSGGCIRLSTKDAREVYAFAPKGARVVVLGALSSEQFATTSQYYLRGGGSPPEVSATAFVVEDVQSGRVLWERNAASLQYAGGLTAMATALTALETVNQYKIVRMGELLLGKAVLRKHSIGAIDEMPVGTFVYPLLFDTNDTAARVFAREHGEKQFVTTMNEKAAAIGMQHTEFSGPLSEDLATTTAHDLATLLRYVESHKHFLVDVTLAKEQTLTDEDGDERYVWTNRNPWILSGDGEFRGGIVSRAAEGGKQNAMLIFDLPVAEFGTRKIAFVVLGSSDVEADIVALRLFVNEHFTYGKERDAAFVREGEEPTPGLLKKAKDLLELEKVLQDEVEYEREV